LYTLLDLFLTLLLSIITAIAMFIVRDLQLEGSDPLFQTENSVLTTKWSWLSTVFFSAETLSAYRFFLVTQKSQAKFDQIGNSDPIFSPSFDMIIIFFTISKFDKSFWFYIVRNINIQPNKIPVPLMHRKHDLTGVYERKICSMHKIISLLFISGVWAYL